MITLSQVVQHHHRPRNGSARQRRREKRATAHEELAAVEEAVPSAEEAIEEPAVPKSPAKVEMETVATNTEETVETTVTMKDFVEITEGTKAVTAEEVNVLVEEPDDEMCPNNIYKGQETPKPTPSLIRGLKSVRGKDYYTMTCYEDYSE